MVEAPVMDLKEIKEVFDKLGIIYWVDWGTLLGAVREGKMIEWDTDIDLGTMSSSWGKIVSAISELEKKGFNVCWEELKIYGNVVERCILFQRSGRPVNMALYNVKGENVWEIMSESTNTIAQGLKILCHLLLSQKPMVSQKWKPFVKVVRRCLSLLPSGARTPFSNVVWRAWRRSGIKIVFIVIPKRYFEKLGTTKFYGLTFSTPFDVEGYLEYHYGKDWKTPKKGWEWHRDEGAVREPAKFMP